jgi:predicted amino acid dehydrogenase
MGACRTSLGTIALVVAPLTDRDLFADRSAAIPILNEAVAHAAGLGARCIALTGLIPAATRLGDDLAAPDGVALTTGHAATASAMAATIHAVAAALSRDPREDTMGFVGLGAIGTATLRLLLACGTHPRSLVLCDVPAKLGHLQSLAREAASTFRFRGAVTIVTTAGTLPEKVYAARFLIGATNVPDVVDVTRLRPGTILVDDSFPLCFDLDRAIHRLRTARDILFAAGGSVRPPGPVDWTLALPPELVRFARDIRPMLPSAEMLPGCMLSALLPDATTVRPTRGEVTAQECLAYWEAFSDLGIDAAPLHCGAWTTTPADIARFRQTCSRPVDRLQHNPEKGEPVFGKDHAPAST